MAKAKTTKKTGIHRKRKPKGWYSAEKLRASVAAWCVDHGGVEMRPSEYNSISDGVLGGTYRLESTIGPWDVHLPGDSAILLSINTCFLKAEPPALPSDANQHSGKWNFNASHPRSGPDDAAAEHLFRWFTSAAKQYAIPAAIPVCARDMGCLCAGHARGNPAAAACDTAER